MDDWSLLPSRNAVSEPAPNHQSPLNPTTSQPNARLDPPRQAPPRRREPLPAGRALDPPGRARQLCNEVRGRAPKPPLRPRIPMITTPIPHTNVKNGQPPLDNTRPFMDDTGRPRRQSAAADRPGRVQRRRKRRPDPAVRRRSRTSAIAQIRARRRPPETRQAAPGHAGTLHRYRTRAACRRARPALGETGSSRSARFWAIALVRLRRRRAGSGRLLRRRSGRVRRDDEQWKAIVRARPPSGEFSGTRSLWRVG